MKEQDKMPLIPIFDIGLNKLDYEKVEEHLINGGHFTEYFKMFDFFDCDYKFEEKPDYDKYSLHSKFNKIIGEFKQGCRYELIIGQSGCFYRITMKKWSISLLYDALKFAGSFNKEIENICKQYVFTPYAVSHFSDGDYFVSEAKYKEARCYCKSTEILNNTQ